MIKTPTSPACIGSSVRGRGAARAFNRMYCRGIKPPLLSAIVALHGDVSVYTYVHVRNTRV